ncbi:MAG: acyltransferase [Kiritimatiellae bacterium]|nr:acyltransferase [Kiritimatiellia bacterium]
MEPEGPARNDETEAAAAKLKGVRGRRGSAARKYFELVYGPMPRWKALLMELCVLLFSGLPGALGLFLRSKLYRPFFGACGRGVVVGRHVTLRHPSKIFLGDGVVLDDNCVVDAKGAGNRGVTLGDGVYVGRNTIVYCKGGDIDVGKNASLSADCIVFSSNRLVLGAGTMVGSFSYLLSGGEYDWRSPVPFAEQAGMETEGPLEIGENCWIGAHVTVLDAASVGAGTTVGAGAVVAAPLPSGCLALGVPARPVRTRPDAAETTPCPSSTSAT